MSTSALSPCAAADQVVEDTARIMDKSWEVVQQKTFTKWVNSKLAIKSISPIESVAEDLSDGRILLQLLSIIGDHQFPRYNKNPKMRIQKCENLNTALEFIKHRGVHLTNIGAEDLVDANLKLVLGLLWTVILRFTINDIEEEGVSAKEGLLLWCQRKTAPYRPHGVEVKDFTFSWTDGLALCALIHRHRPDLLDFYSLKKSDRHANTQLAFDIAERELGIAKLLDVEDLCDMAKPDERSVMTYVAQYFHAFSALDKVESSERRVAKFGDLIQSTFGLTTDYEKRARVLVDSVNRQIAHWQSCSFEGTYTDAKRQTVEFVQYKQGVRREWVAEKRALELILSNLTTKLRTYNLAPYQPPADLTSQAVASIWDSLIDADAKRSRAVNSNMREIKEQLRVNFAKLANNYYERLQVISQRLSDASTSGLDLEGQLAAVRSLQAEFNSASLNELTAANQACDAANIEENDHTIHSLDDLQYESNQIASALNGRTVFLEQQISIGGQSKLTAGQLEEFEATFRHFDTDGSMALNPEEFKAALSALGQSFDDFEPIVAANANAEGNVTLDRFIAFMSDVTEDRFTPAQLRDAFAAVAGGRATVSRDELRRCQIPQDTIDILCRGQDSVDYNALLDSMFVY